MTSEDLERFVEKRQFSIDQECFILLSQVSRHNLDKLRKWLNKGDRIVLFPSYADNELALVNATILNVKKTKATQP